MRTLDEILTRIAVIKDDDLFGSETAELVRSLPWDAARPFLIEEAKEEDWNPALTDDAVRAELVEYLPFALDKATGHRGLSASRSIAHFRAWTWLLGDDDSLAMIESHTKYAPYGMPILRHLCTKYNVDFPATDAALRMGSGEPCTPGCQEGC